MNGIPQPFYKLLFLLLLLGFLGASCRTIEPISDESGGTYRRTDVDPESVVKKIPQPQKPLVRIQGKGKALVSSPGQSDRITVYFSGNQDTSRLTIHNRLGIKSGELLASNDSILIFNRIDKVAQKISYADAHDTRLNSLASANIVNILDYRLQSSVESLWANSQYYLLVMVDKTRIRVDKKNHYIREIDVPENQKVPFSRIQYDGYTRLEGRLLPRKLTITSMDRRSRVTLLIQSLTVNPTDLKLSLDIPDNISIERL